MGAEEMTELVAATADQDPLVGLGAVAIALTFKPVRATTAAGKAVPRAT